MSCTPENYPEKNTLIVPNVVKDSETITNDSNNIDTVYKNTIPQYVENLNFSESKIY